MTGRNFLAGLYKLSARRADWSQEIPLRGLNRQVVVVPSPDSEVFTEAIFILREDWVRKRSAEQVIEEARRAAGAYLVKTGTAERRTGRRLRKGLFVGGAAMVAGAVWMALRLGGVIG